MEDFVVIFNAFWYRDFPAPNGKYVNCENWTNHIGRAVNKYAELHGFYSSFESGNRIDAVINDANDKVIANVEWEWGELGSKGVNKIEKLKSDSNKANFSAFISFCESSRVDDEVRKANNIWQPENDPLLLFVITFKPDGKDRHFLELISYHFCNGEYKKIRSQPALPWDVPNSKWWKGRTE
ncbi:hypothetical protein [Dickeya chrysanthemi]|uniref:hypothetical protein n=1 Tax=Dickeya chrysanthemi TaxID=556 RepID=UPI0012DF9774|nr:hypothetical protein [Dickeya chrysanthemi]